MIAVAVDDGRQPHQAGTHTTSGQVGDRLLGGTACTPHRGRGDIIILGGDPAGRQRQGAEGGHQRPVRAQRLADRGDSRAVDGHRSRQESGHDPAGAAPKNDPQPRQPASVGELVEERGVDGRIGLRGTRAQTVGILDRTPMRTHARGLQARCRCIGTGQPEDLVAVPDQLAHDGRADEPGRSGDEHPHTSHSLERLRPTSLATPSDMPCHHTRALMAWRVI